MTVRCSRSQPQHLLFLAPLIAAELICMKALRSNLEAYAAEAAVKDAVTQQVQAGLDVSDLQGQLQDDSKLQVQSLHIKERA